MGGLAAAEPLTSRENSALGSGPLPADRAPGLSPPSSANAGTCPNTTNYAFDPRTRRCVALPPCPNGLIWNPDRSRCVPRPPGGTLECLDGYSFDTSKDACVAPNCGSMAFSPQQGKCVPPPPVVAYNTLQFVVGTGDDDLRSSSTAWAFWTSPGGTVIYCILHGGGDGWDNNSNHTILCDLGSAPMTLAQLKAAKFSIAYNGAPGNNFDGYDNWNLQSVTINALSEGGPVCVFAASGDPLHRFQDRVGFGNFSDPGLGNNGGADDGIVVTDYPSGCR